MKNKYPFIVICAFFTTFSVFSQTDNTSQITTALPFLQVAADARAAGMGDQGVATSPDAFSQQWNASKYAFAQREIGVAVNYTPYLTKLVNDIALANIAAYKKIDERSAVSLGFRYFSLGEITFKESQDAPELTQQPNSLALGVAYSLQLSDRFAMSVAGRYLRSDLRLQAVDSEANPGNGFGVDITGYYQTEEIPYGNFDGRWRGGFAISNIGPKISFSEGQESFIPTNLRLGGGFDFGLDEYNTVKATIEFSKLLVPTPKDFNEDGEIDEADRQEYNDISSIGGIFSSFGDAPGGFSEELREFTTSIGVEYDYNDVFQLRAGYFNEHETKGARRFVSLGAGFKYTSIGLDVSYLFNTSNIPSPLDGTLRFGLTFNFGEEYRIN